MCHMNQETYESYFGIKAFYMFNATRMKKEP